MAHFVVHDRPVWRSRSTSVIRATIPSPPEDQAWFEQLWARKIDDHLYELCCIPFATYDYALGDILDVAPSGESTHLVHGVVEHSGRSVFRAWLAGADKATWDELEEILRFRRLKYEFRKPALVTIDVADDVVAHELEAELAKLQTEGRLRYEHGSHGYKPPLASPETSVKWRPTPAGDASFHDERTLLGQLPDFGSEDANWAQNERILLQEMQTGNPIRDGSVDPHTGALINNTGFLARQRSLLQSGGWSYDPTTHLWSPGV